MCMAHDIVVSCNYDKENIVQVFFDWEFTAVCAISSSHISHCYFLSTLG